MLDHIYNRIAKRYDLLNTLISFGFDRIVRLRAARLLRTGLILDAATGTGVSAQSIRKSNSDATIIGTDRAADMLEIASSRCSRLVRSDLTQLPFKGDVYDGVSAGFVIRPMEGDLNALSEFFRVLKPGGVTVIYDTLRVPSGVTGLAYRFLLGVYIPICAFLLAGKMYPYKFFTQSIRESITPDELSSRLKSVGFIGIEVTRMLFGTIFIFAAKKPT